MSKKTIDEKIQFSKENILNSRKYLHQKDVLNVLLKNEKTYTLDEVDKLIEDFNKKKFK